MIWFSELRRCRTAGRVLAGRIVSFEDIGVFTFQTMLSSEATRRIRKGLAGG